MKNTLISTVSAGALLMAACSTEAEKAGYYRRYQLPPYMVSQSHKMESAEIEIRDYKPQLVAEVTVTGSRDEAVGKGFKILAGYIFGKNTPKQKIAMTTPVTQLQEINQKKGEQIAMTSPVSQIPAAEGQWKIRFGMPTEYTKENLPEPKDESIRFLMTEPQKMAVIKFSGRMNDEAIAKQQKTLENYLQEQKITAISAAEIAYYDDPFTFPWNRRNEVLIPIKGE